MAENLANDFATTLAGAVDNSTGTLTVVLASGAPAPNFRIRVDDELMLVTAVAGTTWTVTRGVEGTSATTHLIGAPVVHVLTAGALALLLDEKLDDSQASIAGLTLLGAEDAAAQRTALGVAALASAQTFSAEQAIDVSTTAPALRITQRGTGNALVVEDSTSPDLTAFVIGETGKVVIGGAEDFGDSNLTISAPMDGASVSYGMRCLGEIKGSVTDAYVMQLSPKTEAAAFNLSTLTVGYATLASVGAGSTIGTVYGFRASASLGAAGVSTAYSFYSGLGAGADRWGLYMAGSAPNYMAGNVGIVRQPTTHPLEVGGTGRAQIAATGSGFGQVVLGESATASNNWHGGSEGDGTFRLYNGNVGSGTNTFCLFSDGRLSIGEAVNNGPATMLQVRKTSAGAGVYTIAQNPSSATGTVVGHQLITGTTNANSAFALAESSVIGPYAEWQSGAGVTGGIWVTTAGATVPFIVRQGASERFKVQPNGDVTCVSPTGLGYAAGAGGTVTQATSKATAVTLNKPCGRIITDAAALAPNAVVTFTLNNSRITSYDVVSFMVTSGGTAGAYIVQGAYSATGSVGVTIRNITTTPLSEALTINFVVHKSAIT